MTITVNVQDVVVQDNGSIPAASLITSLDASSETDSVSAYEFKDNGTVGHFVIDGQAVDNGVWYTVSPSDLQNVQYVGGTEDLQSDVISVGVYNPADNGFDPPSSLIATTESFGEQVEGTSGNDTFHPGGLGIGAQYWGNGGHDTAILPGPFVDYTYDVLTPGESSVRWAEGKAVPFDLYDIEQLQFGDKTVFVEKIDNANIARLYSAAFDRVPDAAGLFFWEDVYTKNVSATAKSAGYYVALAQTDDGSGTSIAGGFMQSSEFINRYGTLTDAAFVNAMYQNVLGRAPDQAGLNFWIDQIENHGQTREVVLVGFAESPENVSKTSVSDGGWLLQV